MPPVDELSNHRIVSATNLSDLEFVLETIAREKDDESELFVGDARFDGWEVVRDFEDLSTARAWRQHLEENGIEAVMTSDWPLDQFERGDIAVRVPPGRWSDAEDFLSGLDED